MKKIFIISFLLFPSLLLMSCQNKDEEKSGITLPSETSISTSVDYSNDRDKGSYSITSFSPNESISWVDISTTTSTDFQTTSEDDNQIILPTKAD